MKPWQFNYLFLSVVSSCPVHFLLVFPFLFLKAFIFCFVFCQMVSNFSNMFVLFCFVLFMQNILGKDNTGDIFNSLWFIMPIIIIIIITAYSFPFKWPVIRIQEYITFFRFFYFFCFSCFCSCFSLEYMCLYIFSLFLYLAISFLIVSFLLLLLSYSLLLCLHKVGKGKEKLNTNCSIPIDSTDHNFS